MKILISFGAIMFNVLFMPVAQAQFRSEPTGSSTCESTVQSVVNRIEQGRQVMARPHVFDMAASQNRMNYPSDRPLEYTIFLEGKAASDVMNSPQFMQTISTDIIGSCLSVSKVRFNVVPTDWDVSYGLLENGQVERFQCAPDPRANSISWGYIYCL